MVKLELEHNHPVVARLLVFNRKVSSLTTDKHIRVVTRDKPILQYSYGHRPKYEHNNWLMVIGLFLYHNAKLTGTESRVELAAMITLETCL